MSYVIYISQAQRQYGELDQAIVEANLLSELREPARIKSAEWIATSRAARKASAEEMGQWRKEQRIKFEQNEAAYREQLIKEDQVRRNPTDMAD